MEPWQRNHIREKLPQLLIDTVVDASLIAKLIADGVLSDGDVDCLKAIPDAKEKVAKFYDILQTRSQSYNLLKQALMETKQSGAYDILNTCNGQNNLTPFKNCGTISYGKELLGRGCHNTHVVKGKFENRDVAVKKVSRLGIEVPLALREVGILIGLDWHENVVRYYRTEITDGHVLIAMELCDINLHDWVIKPKTVDIEAVEVLRQTTLGIVHLHENKIVHRDLKPVNILLIRYSRGVVRVKIADFGMSNIIPDGQSILTVHTSGVGTEGWMAPEVLQCLLNENDSESILRVGCASDIFSLGCIFYFVLTDGIHPFGNYIRRQVNILDKKFELIEDQITTQNIRVTDFLGLVREMISHDEKDRPLAINVLQRLRDISRRKPIEQGPSSSNCDARDNLLSLHSKSKETGTDISEQGKFIPSTSSMVSSLSPCSNNLRDFLATPVQLTFDKPGKSDFFFLFARFYRVGLSLFNKKPETGIAYLVNHGLVSQSPSDIAKLLVEGEGISKHMIGQYLANPSSMAILEAFSKEINMNLMAIDSAIREFQTKLELQIDHNGIDRLLESFTRRYAACNPNFTSKFSMGKDTVYKLTYAILMLNSDLHTPGLENERRMKVDDFIKNLEGVDGGEDVEREMLTEIYGRIQQAEMKTGPDHVTQVLAVQQSIVGRKLDLALPHRRLSCHIRLFDIPGFSKKNLVLSGFRQREVFLFNDLLVITKRLQTKTTQATYSFLQDVNLAGVTLLTFANQYNEQGFTLEKGDNVIVNLGARTAHDRKMFEHNLNEAIAESNELDRVERLLETAAKSDSGMNAGKIKRLSLSDIRDESDQHNRPRRVSS